MGDDMHVGDTMDMHAMRLEARCFCFRLCICLRKKMSFFGRSVLSPSALRAHYLALVAVHHPDRGGDEAVMSTAP